MAAKSKKDPRLVEVEEDFEKVEKFLRNEPVRKSKRVETLMQKIGVSLTYLHGALEDCTKLYRLKKNRYPDSDIIETVKQKLQSAQILLPSKKNLFT